MRIQRVISRVKETANDDPLMRKYEDASREMSRKIDELTRLQTSKKKTDKAKIPAAKTALDEATRAYNKARAAWDESQNLKKG